MVIINFINKRSVLGVGDTLFVCVLTQEWYWLSLQFSDVLV